MAGETEIRLAVIVVVYNTSCEESITCRKLVESGDNDLQVVIYDNSTRDFGNQGFCESRGWKFLGGKGNVGLSKAYNQAIQYLQQAGTSDIVCLFDDDTDIEPDYFSTLRFEAAKTPENKIFVPVIYADNRILSPCILTKTQAVRLFASEQEIFDYNGTELTAINTGMAIRLELFEDYQYDENIFLDGIDHKFIRDMKQKGYGLTVMNSQLRQHFSGDEKPSLSSALARFQIFLKDNRYIFRNNRLIMWKLVGKRALRLTIQYKTAAFLRMLMKS
jgi:rhamnosyltransferase